MSYGDNGRMNKKFDWIFCFLYLADFTLDFRIDQVESIVVVFLRDRFHILNLLGIGVKHAFLEAH